MDLRFKLTDNELEPLMRLIKKFKSTDVTVDAINEEYYNREVVVHYEKNKGVLTHDMELFYKAMCFLDETSHSSLRNIKVELLEDMTVSPSSFLSDKKMEVLLDDINLLDTITSDIVCEQEKVIEKLEAIYNFLNSSGLLHYKKTMEHLIDKLDEHKIVNKELINKQIFPTIH